MKTPQFTERQKKNNLKKGIAALRANKKKAIGRMRRVNTGGRCCLCVLADTAEEICKLRKGSLSGTFFPEINLSKVFAVKSDKDKNILIGGTTASTLNDTKRKSHAVIADMLEKEYLAPKKVDKKKKAK